MGGEWKLERIRDSEGGTERGSEGRKEGGREEEREEGMWCKRKDSTG